MFGSARLVKRRLGERIDLEKAEAPFFAAREVMHAIQTRLAGGLGYCPIWGLDKLIDELGCRYMRSGHTSLENKLKFLFEDESWYLLKDRPFSPLAHQKRFDIWNHRKPSDSGQYSEPAGNGISRPVQADPVEPGFHIAEQFMSEEQLEQALFIQADENILRKFRSLNRHLADGVRPGQLIILSDPDNPRCTREEAQLMQAAQRVDEALAPLTDAEISFHIQHRETIDSFLNASSLGISVGASVGGQHLERIGQTLMNIELLHKNTFATYGRLNTPEFFDQRAQLFRELDNRLGALTRSRLKIPEHPRLKHALGISSRSLVHHWSKAGVTDIPGYSTHVQRTLDASRWIKRGGWIGTALNGSVSALRIQEACTLGDEQECRRVSIVESGRFGGSVTGGGIGAKVGIAAGPMTCAALGLGGGVPGVICMIAVVGSTSAAGGAIGETTGEWIAEGIYEFAR